MHAGHYDIAERLLASGRRMKSSFRRTSFARRWRSSGLASTLAYMRQGPRQRGQHQRRHLFVVLLY